VACKCSVIFAVGRNKATSVKSATQQIVGTELLTLAQIESSLGHNRFGGWRYLRQPAIGTTQALDGLFRIVNRYNISEGGINIEK
jgi:hypothetical protein